ncbi:hypothetical protein J6590_047351 [Homalodisca vitripennis]|nr:hypothetical protein J6590_047351 [Homalodisca vitripennis]
MTASWRARRNQNRDASSCLFCRDTSKPLEDLVASRRDQNRDAGSCLVGRESGVLLLRAVLKRTFTIQGEVRWIRKSFMGELSSAMLELEELERAGSAVQVGRGVLPLSPSLPTRTVLALSPTLQTIGTVPY